MTSQLTEALQVLIEGTANDNPAPKICSIVQVYDDGHVDVGVNLGEEEAIILYRPYIGYPVVGDEAVIVFIAGSEKKGFVICNDNFLVQMNDLILNLTNYKECE